MDIKKEPFTCPCCTSTNIKGKLFNTTMEDNKQVVSQECLCVYCKTKWVDKYILNFTQILNGH